MAGFFDSGGDLNKAIDPGGVMSTGGILGPADNSAQQAQAAFLQMMMGREGELYPELKQQLSDAGLLTDQALQAIQSGTGAAYDSAMSQLKQVQTLAPQQFAAATGPSSKLFGGAVSSIQDAAKNAQSLNLPPEALSALNKIKEERLAGLSNDTNNLIGSKISDYARRGVTSSSTAEGMGNEVGKALEPAINQAEADYQQARLDLPSKLYGIAKDAGTTTYGMGVEQGNIDSQAYKDLMSSLSGNAMNQYNLASGQSQLLSGALTKKANSLIDPFLDMWKTSSGVGSTTPAAQDKNTAGASAIGSIGAAIASM